MSIKEHRMKQRVFYGDTDAAGVIYYANYLRYVEAGRYEFIRELGIDLAAYHEEGVVFAVVDVTARYHRSGKLGDEIEIRTELGDVSPSTITFESSVYRTDPEEILFSAEVRAACLNGNGRPRRIPSDISDILKGALKG